MNTQRLFPLTLVELVVALAFVGMVGVFIYQETFQKRVNKEVVATLQQFHEIYLGSLDYRSNHNGQWPNTVSDIDPNGQLQCSSLKGNMPSSACGSQAAWTVSHDNLFLKVHLDVASDKVTRYLQVFLQDGRLTDKGLTAYFPIPDVQRKLNYAALQIKDIVGIDVTGDQEKDIRFMKPHCPDNWIPKYDVAHKHFYNGHSEGKDCFIQSKGSVASPGRSMFFHDESYDWYPNIQTDSRCPAPKSEHSGTLLSFFFCSPQHYDPQGLLQATFLKGHK